MCEKHWTCYQGNINKMMREPIQAQILQKPSQALSCTTRLFLHHKVVCAGGLKFIADHKDGSCKPCTIDAETIAIHLDHVYRLEGCDAYSEWSPHRKVSS